MTVMAWWCVMVKLVGIGMITYSGFADQAIWVDIGGGTGNTGTLI
jgi:hypothetical protein